MAATQHLQLHSEKADEFEAIGFVDNFFVAQPCHQPELDGFYQHFQASIHFTLTSAMAEFQQHRKLLSEMLSVKPGTLGEKQECYLCAMQPLQA